MESTKEYFERLNPDLKLALGEIMKEEKTPERLMGEGNLEIIDKIEKIINKYSKDWNEEEMADDI